MMQPRQDVGGDASFLRELLRLLRGQAEGAWDGKSERELLGQFLTGGDGPERGDAEPDPDLFWRIEVFHSAVGLAIEARTGVVCTPMLRMHHEGFGRLVLVGGRLVVVSRFLRDVSRFGFDSVEKLAEAGERLVQSGVAMIARHPDVARQS